MKLYKEALRSFFSGYVSALRRRRALTQEEMAQLVGSSRETVNKALMDFANRRWIAREGRSIIIYQPGMLIRRSRR